MAGARRISYLLTAIALSIGLLGACDSEATSPDPGFGGHWTSPQWGEHYIVVDGPVVKIVYAHDDGRVLATLDGTKVTGWWTESPSRKPSRDAGEVIFTLTTDGDQRRVDGEWRYGAEGALRENWDLTWVDAEIPADVRTKLSDAAAFTAHP